MPAINIPGVTDYKAIRGVVERRTDRQYKQALSRESNARSKLNEQSAAYFDKTGTSQASQEQEKIDLSKARNQIDIAELNRKYQQMSLDLSKEDRDQMNNLISQMSLVHQYSQKTGDEEGASNLYDAVLEANPSAAEHFSKTPFSKYNKDLVGALATIKQINDPLTPINYAEKRADGTWSIGSISRDDEKAKQTLTRPGVIFDPSGQVFSGMKDFNPINNAAWRNQLSANESNFVQIHGIIDELRSMAPEIKDWQRGLSGTVLRKVENMSSAVSSLAQTLAKESNGTIIDANGNYISDSTWLQRELGKFSGPSAAQNRLVVQLGYLTARMQEGSQGRALSELDFKRNVEGLNGSEEQQKATLNVIEKQLNQAMKFNYEQANVASQQSGGPTVPIPPTIQKYLGQAEGQGNSVWNNMSEENKQEALRRVKENPQFKDIFEKTFGFTPTGD